MKIGFIGCGNMASAMIGGIIKNQVVAPMDILASAKTEVSREKKKEELGIAMTADNRGSGSICRSSDSGSKTILL